MVHGIGGRREFYRPIHSQLTPSSDPVAVARAFRDHFGLSELYLADLDAIAGMPPACHVYTELHSLGFRLWVDAGVRETRTAQLLAEAGVATIVLGLETLAGPDVLAEACTQWGWQRVVFSIDLKDGVLLGNVAAWSQPDARSIAAQAVSLGMRRLLVLDLARVGVGVGLGTEKFCAELVSAYPDVEVTPAAEYGARTTCNGCITPASTPSWSPRHCTMAV